MTERWLVYAFLLGVGSMLGCSSACNAGSAAASTVPAWTEQSATELVGYIENVVPNHGLDPEDYGAVALRQAIVGRNRELIEEVGERSFRLLARDLLRGAVPPSKRRRAHFAEPNALHDRIDSALAKMDALGTPTEVLESLAPQHRQYRALRSALSRAVAAGDLRSQRLLTLNLERWRWLPRELGARYILVNLPAYSLSLVEADAESRHHRVIIGKLSTPTPQFAASVEAVIFNPTWTVPQSIIAESAGRLIRTDPGTARARGYTWSRNRSGRLTVVQRPGPGNALGQVKLDMPNRFTVYAHDTPSKNLFGEPVRTFSHGCIRVDEIIGLAEAILGPDAPDSEEVDSMLDDRVTRRLALPSPVPIYIVYVTAIAAPDGWIEFFDDPYLLDDQLTGELKFSAEDPAFSTGAALQSGGCA